MEIGCGQGFLLSSLKAEEKYATELSLQALRQAQKRSGAQLSLAVAERLPFEDEYFDLVAAVGIMEHFLDAGEALEQIRRVLKPKGYFVNLSHIELTFWDLLLHKISQYIFPRPRPVALVRWLLAKVRPETDQPQTDRPETLKQPIWRGYTIRGARSCLVRAGFNVLQTMHTRKYPELPLVDGAKGGDRLIFGRVLRHRRWAMRSGEGRSGRPATAFAVQKPHLHPSHGSILRIGIVFSIEDAMTRLLSAIIAATLCSQACGLAQAETKPGGEGKAGA